MLHQEHTALGDLATRSLAPGELTQDEATGLFIRRAAAEAAYARYIRAAHFNPAFAMDHTTWTAGQITTFAETLYRSIVPDHPADHPIPPYAALNVGRGIGSGVRKALGAIAVAHTGGDHSRCQPDCDSY